MNHACQSFRRSVSRRSFLRIGGLGLCGLGALDVFSARERALAAAYQGVKLHAPKAKQLLVVWLAGGPPHTDMFDMKPDSPSAYKSQYSPIGTNVDGLQVCDLMPNLAKMADKYCVIRSVTTMNKPGDHARAPMYWLTGNPRLPSGTDEYPMYGSVVSRLRPGPRDLPSFAVLGKIDHHINNSIANSFLGPAHSPFIFDPLQQKDDIAKMLTPQMELPSFDRNADLLKAVDRRLRTQDRLDPVIEGLDKHQQTAFDMLRSPRLREALDLSKEPEDIVRRYTAADPAKLDYTNDGNTKHYLMARRLIEAGVPVVHFSFGYWDWHGKNFSTGRRMIPRFDAAFSALLEDLEQRGLLDTTIVLALGEMGRKPKFDNGDDPGRDHWDYAQFAIAAGGGFKGGTVVGATDKLGEQVTDKFYEIESFGATLYHLMGIDPESRVTTASNRPISLIAEPAPIIREALGVIMPRSARQMDYHIVMAGTSDSSDVDTPDGDPSPVVLVVEDDALVRGYIVAVLEAAGFGVLEAATGAQALSSFDAERARIVAVVVDHTLPNVSGLEIAAKMRAAGPDLPIILTSGHQNPVIPANLAGPRTVFLQKPFPPDQLIGQLQKLVG